MTERNFLQRCCRGLVNVIVLVSLAWFLVFGFFTQLSMSGHSMEPCLYSGDTVMLDTLSYHFFSPGRMDVVAFQRADGNVTVKRVVGLPGETVIIQNGHIYIDGKLLETDKISEISLSGLAENPITLLPDEYFLIGDNADSSEDSRFQNVGNVRSSQVLGRVWLRVLPFGRFGLIH